MCHLILSMGNTSHLIAEVVGFLNYEQYPLYQKHLDLERLLKARSDCNLKPISTLSLICTEQSFHNNHRLIEDWQIAQGLKLEIKYHYVTGMGDIVSAEDTRIMRNLIFSVVYSHRIEAKISELYLCLSGGRKTMSSDMQQAAYYFGCKAMLHILADGIVSFDLCAKAMAVPQEEISKISPVVYQTDIVSSRLAELMDYQPDLLPEYRLAGDEFRYKTAPTKFLDKIEGLQKEQDNLAYNYYYKLNKADTTTNFHALHLLNPDRIAALKSTRITGNNNAELSEKWLLSLPKTDLHSHLGGYASSSDLITIAEANSGNFGEKLSLTKWQRTIKEFVKTKDLISLSGEWQTLQAANKQERWLRLCPFLVCFEDCEPLLDELIFGRLLDEKQFVGIGLQKYEQIGDFQGSSLLQTENSLRMIARLIDQDAKKNNLLYKEIRCSPGNYTHSLTAREVVEILWSELKDSACTYRLIIIGSRHRSLEMLKKHVELCLDFKKRGGKIGDFICGFDLAGPEGLVSPASLRSEILPILEHCLRITIHAGETSSVQDIWEAVYQLNADRIGHGLFLDDNDNLRQKLKDNRTAIEMCPSSNFQITGFRDYALESTRDLASYPLHRYLREGIKACICTDDQGLSRTDISKEYLKACRLTQNGLSKWDILALIRNGFVSAFIPSAEKQNLIREAESRILELV